MLVAGQPHGASTWLPCVDSPTSRSTAEITLTCDAGYLPVANGVGAPVRTRGSRVTWRWRLDQPVPAYLLSVQIGRYRLVDAAPPAEGLPPLVRARMEKLAGSRMSNDGWVVITAQTYRSQERNRQDAMSRLVGLIRKASVAPKPRRATRPTKAAKTRRLDSKTRRGSVKSLRGRPKAD